MHRRIPNFFINANNALYEGQYGFRAGRSYENLVTGIRVNEIIIYVLVGSILTGLVSF